MDKADKDDLITIPDRYEALSNITPSLFNYFIVEVKPALEKIDDVAADMYSAGRGGFLIFFGQSGVGKTTFLHTLSIFRQRVEIVTIENDVDISNFLDGLGQTQGDLRIVIIEGREAIRDSPKVDIETWLHRINKFIRNKAGRNTLVIWLCNTVDMRDSLVKLAGDIGGDSLLGLSEPFYEYIGPGKKDFVIIANNTIQVLNNGANILSLGITDEYAATLAEQVDTIGKYLGHLRYISRKNTNRIKKLVSTERCKMWVVVLAGNDPEKDVASLTSGSLASADIKRMMVATKANIVEEIKRYSEQIGNLSAFFGCKVLYVPILAALAVVRDFADSNLKQMMTDNGLSTKPDGKGIEKLLNSELVSAFANSSIGMGKKGKSPGSNTLEAFQKISNIASKNDRILNKTIAEALLCAGIIKSYELENDFGQGLTRRTDIYCQTQSEVVRLELMWRRTTSQAEIANYTLRKLYYYGRAIGLLE